MTGLSLGLGVLLLGSAWLLSAWRGLVAARDAADATWSAIDVHLCGRHALVPEMVAAIEAETSGEEPVLAQLRDAHGRALAARTAWERAETERRLVAAIAVAAAAAERHPGLGAAAGFVDVQARLAALEDEIQAARRIYNADVRLYRGRRGHLPGALLRRLGDFDDRPYFQLDQTRERSRPKLALARA